MDENKQGKITWMQVVNAIVQAIIAAMTALTVSSCVGAV